MSKSPFRIHVVEDNEWYNKMLVYTLSMNDEYHVEGFTSGKDLLDALHHKPNVITLDFRLPDMDGLELLEKIREQSPHSDVIVISEQKDIETAVNLIKRGAYDYLVKEGDIRDQLSNLIQKIEEKQELRQEVDSLKQEIQKKYEFANSMIGNSPGILGVFDLMEKALDNSLTVLITGETGTGKEVVAKAIHYNSDRKTSSFVAVNVAAIPDDLIESELFGHEKGAFTGAITKRKGKFEEAHNGTLFLDEIGEMRPEMQAKLLRALQEREITRVGGNSIIKTNCRIIVATNKNLKEEMKEGRFREDLYYRLYGLPISLPPLRERENDILLLARHFIREFCKENEMQEKTLSEPACHKLLSYSWPGNVRELKSVVELSVVMSGAEHIEPENILLSDDNVLSSVISKELTLREFNIQIVKIFMNRCNNDMKLVAEKLGIGHTTVYRLLKEDKEKSA